MNTQQGVTLSGEAEQFYRHVLRSARAEVDEHAVAMGWPIRRAQRVARELERLRLVIRTDKGVLQVDDPRAAVGRLVDREEAALDQRRATLTELRSAMESYEQDYRRGLQREIEPSLPAVERISAGHGPAVVDRLYRTSEGDVLQVSAEVAIGPGYDEDVRRKFREVLAGGRVIRSIFPRSMLLDPRLHALASARAEAGEQQRFLPDDQIRVDFGVWGRTGVLLDEGGGADSDYLLLRTPVVLDAFTTLFEELWRRAEPVSRDASAEDVKILDLLSLGLKDEAVARQLGLGLRTVRRRIAALMEDHGVDTRFQLGLAVGGRDLLGDRRR
ncbi:hypothetical protein [Ornithinimicrobium sp. Y1694]|uniref:hypothetical protein n=1 Tax=Ornithinimicrobium sp. Y1694 TaxID=3418590 RepID=UPI003CF38ECF